MRLEIISDHKDLPPACRSFAFGETGGTIGRGLNNDWILPDPERFISNHHAKIECIEGRFCVVDLSTNGIFLNNSRKPVARGERQRLSNGDILRMGNFAIHVYIDESVARELEDESATWSVTHGDSTTAKRPPLQLAVVDSSNVLNFVQNTATHPAPVAAQVARITSNETTCGGTSSVSRPIRMQFSEQVLRERIRLLTAFFEGLGLDIDDMDFDQDPARTLKRAGQMLGAFIASTMQMLGSRSSIKGHFRLDQTSVLVNRDNPLKSTDNSTQATRQLLGQTGNYPVGPVAAVQEAMHDVDQHNKAVIAAMQAAFDNYIAELDPDELQAGFDASIGRSGMFRKVNGIQYWPMYKDLYPVITGRSPGHFPEAFVQEFVKAYEHYMSEHKLHPKADPEA